MKIVVYAIAKNEGFFVDRWMDSMSEADQVVVLDTGSDDGTAERLRARGAQVTVERIVPWRFDRARNRSLELVPEDADVCVCTDLDEVFHPGWRSALERAWTPGTRQASYRYTWSFQPDGSEGVVFWQEKIHARRGFRWVHPVHEVLEWVGEGERGEDPEDDRNLHYLGREYLYYGRWDDCIRTLTRHLALPSAVWRDERAASMRYIARAHAQKGERDEARDWYLRAAAEAPHLREPWVDLAMLLYEDQEWDGVLYATCLTTCAVRPITTPGGSLRPWRRPGWPWPPPPQTPGWRGIRSCWRRWRGWPGNCKEAASGAE